VRFRFALIVIMLLSPALLGGACEQGEQAEETPTATIEARAADISETPQPTLRAPPTRASTVSPTEEAAVQEAAAELFWIAADIAGIPRTTPFEDAKTMLQTVLFQDFDSGLRKIEQFGVDPFATWPYCINAISGVMAHASLGLSESPAEAGAEAHDLIAVIEMLDDDVMAARETGRGRWSPTESKQLCDQFEDEARAKRGLPPMQR